MFSEDRSTGEPIVETWEYDEEGRLVHADERVPCHCVSDQHWISRYEYSDDGVVTTVDVDADGTIDTTIRYDFNDEGLLETYKRVTADRTHETTYIYDDLGRLIETLDDNGDSDRAIYVGSNITTRFYGSSAYSYEYDGQGRMLSEVRPSGARTNFEYDAEGRLSGERYESEGGAIYTTELAYGRPAGHHHHAPEGQEGQLISNVTRSTELGGAISTEQHYEYDSASRLVFRSNADNRTGLTTEEFQTYDEAGRPIADEYWQRGELFSWHNREWRYLSGDEIEVAVTSDGAPMRIVYRRLGTDPITPPELPRLGPKLPNVIPRFDTGISIHR